MTRRDFQFFFREAGYVVGQRAQGALTLARAEDYATDQGWTYEWADDDYADRSWMDEATRKRGLPAFGCILKDAHGETLTSLWGIFDPDATYMRVIQAELASEFLPSRRYRS